MSAEPIAIVGYGCVLPGASNSDQFWDLLLAAEPQFRSLPVERWGVKNGFLRAGSEPDTTYSDIAAYVDDRLLLNADSKTPRLHQMVSQALDEATSRVSPPLEAKNRQVGVILGCMNAEDYSARDYFSAKKDELYEDLCTHTQFTPEGQKILKEVFEKHSHHSDSQRQLQRAFTSSLGALIHERLSTSGPAFCVDTACASSMTALDLSLRYLREGLIDIAITGGAEGNLGLETFIPFARLGVLSRGKSLPFDFQSDGIVQGEGAVLFILERFSDAVEKKHQIYGLIQGVAGASNGSQASLFSPSVEAQLKITLTNNEEFGTDGLLYVEGHGTGTPVGDLAELQALSQGLAPVQTPIYTGSVKSLIGHTKGTAGAAGVLKCLLSLKHETLPPSPYFRQFSSDLKNTGLQINQSAVSLKESSIEKIQMRINSSGFGGANYQLVIRHPFFQPAAKRASVERREDHPTTVVAFYELPFSNASEESRNFKWKIPPAVIDQLDVSQLASLVAVRKALEQSLIPISRLVPDKTVVIYAAASRTITMESILESIDLKKISQNPLLSISLAEKVMAFAHQTHSFSENSCQSLCSMVSGRVAHEFNWTGIHFHVDADFASPGYGFQQADILLKTREADTVILLFNNEEARKIPILIERSTLQAWFLCSEEFAVKNDLPILGKLNPVEMSYEKITLTIPIKASSQEVATGLFSRLSQRGSPGPVLYFRVKVPCFPGWLRA